MTSATVQPRLGKAGQYDRHKASAARRQSELAAAGSEIGPIPPVANPVRRMLAAASLRAFSETYFPAIFYLAWSTDHKAVIAAIETAIATGSLFSMAMPRGSGKSSLCLVAALWAVLTGRLRFVVLIAANAPKAASLLSIVKNACETNELLAADWPEAVWPIQRLERVTQRQRAQTYLGVHTRIEWLGDRVVFPWIPGSASAGGVLAAVGLESGNIRGMIHAAPDGKIMRPDFSLVDDPQTRQSAHSQSQSALREKLIAADVLGMSGPGKKIGAVLCCTIIRPGDMADALLDTEKHPEWHSRRMKMVYQFPTNEKLWDEYAALYVEGLKRRDIRPATEFYRARREAMDAGSLVAWPENFPNDCLSALQYAMNLKIRDEDAFWSERQNEPKTDQAEEPTLTAAAIAAKLNRRPEGAIPTSCGKLVMYIDVHKRLLYYAIVAVEGNFTTYLVEYGTWPEQKAQHFQMREARRTLLTAHPGHGEEAAIYAGLEALCREKIGKAWGRDDGAVMRISLCLIDSGYQKNSVELFCKQSAYASVVLPAKGLGVGAASIPLDERAKKKGEEIGDNWRITGAQGEYSTRLVLIDTNHWKSFLQARLAVPIGDAGCLSLWGRSEGRHRMLADHLASETRVRTEGRGRKLDEWRLPPHKPDNHLLDCCVGCQAAASMLGARLLGKVLPREKPHRAARKKARYF